MNSLVGTVKNIVRLADDGDRLDIKRCYLPFKVISACPVCNVDVAMNLQQDYLSFPSIGQPSRINFYHVCSDGKDEEWEVYVTVGVTLTATKAP